MRCDGSEVDNDDDYSASPVEREMRNAATGSLNREAETDGDGCSGWLLVPVLVVSVGYH